MRPPDKILVWPTAELQTRTQNDQLSESLSFLCYLTFAHSGTVVNDKGSDIFVISHGESFVLFCKSVLKG